MAHLSARRDPAWSLPAAGKGPSKKAESQGIGYLLDAEPPAAVAIAPDVGQDEERGLIG